jgi:hypothetical protein
MEPVCYCPSVLAVSKASEPISPLYPETGRSWCLTEQKVSRPLLTHGQCNVNAHTYFYLQQTVTHQSVNIHLLLFLTPVKPKIARPPPYTVNLLVRHKILV